jgi:hypothetical protein
LSYPQRIILLDSDEARQLRETRCSERLVAETMSSKIGACRNEAFMSGGSGTLDVSMRAGPVVRLSAPGRTKGATARQSPEKPVNITFPATSVPAIIRARR